MKIFVKNFDDDDIIMGREAVIYNGLINTLIAIFMPADFRRIVTGS